jgi:hypothetical protein
VYRGPGDLAHSAFAQLLQDAIGAKRLANHARILFDWASARLRHSARTAPLARAEAGPPAPIAATISYGPKRAPGSTFTEVPQQEPTVR